LGNLIYLYDDNHITIEGNTSLAFSEDVSKRFEAYHWHVQKIDGYDLKAIEDAIRSAQAVTDRPSIISVRTHIGFGSPNKQDTAEAHGSPLGEAEVRLTKQKLGWPSEETFYIPAEALQVFRESLPKGEKFEAEWQSLVKKFSTAHPEKFQEWQLLLGGGCKAGWEGQIPSFTGDTKPMATREASGKVLTALFPVVPGLIGGSADLAPSTNTYVKSFGDFEANNYAGRNFHFGIREHAMGATLNGMALHGGVVPYGATFLVFSDYMRPSVRLAAMMGLHVVYVWTHDSIGLGEDGPTHQPVEHLAALRAIPGLVLIRPCDASETAEAWRAVLRHEGGPVALALTRQKLPVIDRRRYAAAGGLHRGAYVLAEAEGGSADVIVMATGSEVHPAMGARDLLQARGVRTRVVSLPSWELFGAQDAAYRESVISKNAKLRVSVEAAVTFGWQRWVGQDGLMIGLDRFGASAPYEILMKEFGFTADGIADKILRRLG
jgi:transketolase